MSATPFWTTFAVVGFVLVNALVIALGASSTARYEFGRNRVRAEQDQERAAAVGAPAAAAALPEAPSGEWSGERSGEEASDEAELHRQVAVSLAAHPAGKLSASGGADVGWWLVAEETDSLTDSLADDLLADDAAHVVAGPFRDRVDADWFALAHGLAAGSVYGVRRAGGGEIVLRPSPDERAWLGELGDHLDRLGDEWDALLSDTDPVTTLAVEVAAALVEAGLSLHDCAGDAPAGGVCLTPASGLSGLLVSWHQHDRAHLREVRGEAADAAQRTMSGAVAAVLAHHGFAVQPLGGGASHLVTSGAS